MTLSWVPVLGEFDTNGDELVFKGRLLEGLPGSDSKPQPLIGQCLSNRTFKGGKVSCDVKFTAIVPGSVAEIILSYDPLSRDMVTVGLGGDGYFFSLRQWSNGNNKWVNSVGGGSKLNLQAEKSYHLEVTSIGSAVSLAVDGVVVGSSTQLQFHPVGSQVGVFCINADTIHFSHFEVEHVAPKAFIVMQFSQPYDELYIDVIKPLCLEAGLVPNRADETAGPGMILADIQRDIVESTVIIAEITPANPNVYYEVGYAHALKKPTILIADKTLPKLPFDVSPFRTLMYENSIGGKKKVEEGLRKFLRAILPDLR